MQQTIVDATLRCLQKYSIEKTNISTIAREAKVTRATLYSYFSTKEHVLHVALLQVVNLFCTRLLKHIEKFNKPEERLLEAMVFICLEIPKDPYLRFIIDPVMAQQVNAMTLTAKEGESVRMEMLKVIFKNDPRYRNSLEDLCELVTRMVVSVLVMKPIKKKTKVDLYRLFRKFISMI